jgi:hypothetical protein
MFVEKQLKALKRGKSAGHDNTWYVEGCSKRFGDAFILYHEPVPTYRCGAFKVENCQGDSYPQKRTNIIVR